MRFLCVVLALEGVGRWVGFLANQSPTRPLQHHATQAEKCAPIDCVAVEDSGSGVGSAANAGMGRCACVRVRACVPLSVRVVCGRYMRPYKRREPYLDCI